MKNTPKQYGFSLVELIALVIGICILAAVGYVAIKDINSLPKATTATTTSSTSSVPSKIQSKADIRQTIQSLNNDKSDKELDPSQLDADLSNLL